MKISLKSNFSFKKLSKNFEKVIQDNNFDIISDLAKQTKQNINSGGLPALTDATKEARSKGLSSFSKSVNTLHNPNEDTNFIPLKYSGDLEKSIVAKDDGIQMRKDGLNHHKGNWRTPKENIGYGANKSVIARPFIAGNEELPLKKDKFEEYSSRFMKIINKAMRK